MSDLHKTLTFIVSLLIVTGQLSGFEIRDGWYYVDGEKFFIKGIGYETHTRPGQLPWEYEFNAAVIEYDLQKIKEAGFNTIRTWGAISEEELCLVEASGLKILFGIWIDPHGDYGDPNYINNSLNHVSGTLAYTKKYSCILAYIIMNEPQVEDVVSGGPDNLISLWQSVIDIIHESHPGIPVTISNTAVGDYIRSDLFQISAYNLYIYNPVLISNSHGYAGYCQFIKQHRSKNTPLIITEFGLSVSPGQVNDDYTYGGNTLDQQVSGNLLMYRGLIDGGAQGGCVFQYHDGWWKGGNENTHDESPEEWFGLIEFDSNPGTFEGTPRPAWDACAKYNQAIVYEPKNQQIYTQSVPVELFMTDAVNRVRININDDLVSDFIPQTTYYFQMLTPEISDSIKDLRWDFKFYDKNNFLIKEESINSLLVQSPVTLPVLEMAIMPKDLNLSSQINLILDITNMSLFTIRNNQLDYSFFPHIGFSPGEARTISIPDNISQSQFTDFFNTGSDTKVVTFGAGYSIQYGNFNKRIFTQKIIFRGDWAEPISAKENVSIEVSNREGTANQSMVLSNYPNPFNSFTVISFVLPRSENVTISIFNLSGQRISEVIRSSLNRGRYQYRWSPDTIPSGIYLIFLQTPSTTITRKILLLK